MTYDKERIAKILADLEKYLRDLQTLKSTELSDSKTYYATSMLLFAIANRTIDLGDAIVTGGEFGFPSTYKTIFSLLAKHGVITKEMEQRLADVVHYRNVLSHEYADVSAADIRTFWRKIGIITDFMTRIKMYLAKRI